MSEEQEKWKRMVTDLRQRFTLQTIGDEIGLTARQVFNIQAGAQPKGMSAIKLYLFHMKHYGSGLPEAGSAVHSHSRI